MHRGVLILEDLSLVQQEAVIADRSINSCFEDIFGGAGWEERS